MRCIVAILLTLLTSAAYAQSTPQQYDSACGTAGHDCTSAMNACIATGACHLACGTYDTASGVAVGTLTGLSLSGSGYCSNLRATSDVNVLQLTPPSGYLQHVTIEGLRISYKTPSTSSKAITGIGIGQLNDIAFNRLWIEGAYYGIWLNGAGANSVNAISFSNVSIFSCGKDGITVGAAGPSSGISNYDSTSYVSSCKGNGIHIAGGIAAVLNGNTQINGGNGLLIDSATGASNREIFLGPAFMADSNTGHGVMIASNSISLIDCSGCWMAGNGGSGISIEGQGGGAVPAGGTTGQFAGCHSYANKSTGINIVNDPGMWLIDGCILNANLYPIGTANLGTLTVTSNIANGNAHGFSLGALRKTCNNNQGSNTVGGC